MPLTEQERAVLDRIDVARILALAADLIGAGGENPGGTEAETVQVLAAACRDQGLTVEINEIAPGRPNLTATLPGQVAGEPGVMFLGHSDVVPAGDGWTRGPFEPYVDGARLFGRGSTDMKGGLAAIVVAMSALQEAEIGLPGPVQLACTVDEEDLGLGIRAFAPAVAHGEFKACIVAEPTDLSTVIGCRGDCYLEVTVTGRPAHSGRPDDGRNAINAAARIIDITRRDHESRRAGADALLGAGTWNVGQISGGIGTSVVAAECRISIDRRLMPDEDAQTVAADLISQIHAEGIDTDGIEVRVDVTMEMPGFRTDADHPLVRSAVTALADVGAGASEVGGWTAACDGGFIARDVGVPTIVMGPGGLNDQAHRADESVSLAELEHAAKAYALMCIRLMIDPNRRQGSN
ncbi:M20 family metallopeptidase [Saxibacter everestensis]|uniref:Probable succinyl-diaminopimelate desuccinylase n=2 Tax=Saxibacter everestensis TaxID=2909229 RepID=A0ABY8QYN3_9MICO|nr:M20 family metallopeptidase [Brevibacteriaceae bacterium ZFBP1038]